ncbi:tyrosine-protein phosphatase [Mollicutes bacterium LVI A0039]|nr:tyrosine-protein phosphatase [Mollicutes bacterium LVI A0039]
MKNILNYRMLADGKTNKDGKVIKNIYRSADVSRASSTDIEELLSNNICNIIDLRSSEEISTLLNHEQISIENIDIIGDGKQNELDKYSAADISTMMIDLYERKFLETSGFKKEFAYIESLQGKPFLFHCTAGKDRTGITGAILMHLLDFSYEDIKNEYLQIDETLVMAMTNKIMKQFENLDVEVDLKALRAIASVDESFLESFFMAVTDKYGTLDHFINVKLGITSEMIDNLKKYYLV